MSDKIIIEVLADGTIKTETDKVSMPNHANAEGFLRQLARLAGGVVDRIRKGHGHHGHGHTHGEGEGEHHHH